MYSVIGLGGVGCRVAQCFSQYPQYNIVLIDDEKYADLNLGKFNRPEEYEAKCKQIPKTLKAKIKENVIFIVSGASMTSSASLRILEQIKSKNVTLIYIRPELDLLEDTKRQQEKVVFSVLQEYTRSGLFDMIYLVDNSSVDVLVEDASIKDYYPAINRLITSSFHMMKVFENQESVVDNYSHANIARRIATMGIMNLGDNTETMFFPMEEVMNVKLYYGISSKSLNEDTNLQRSIINLIKQKNSELCKYSYGVYETQYDSDFCYVKTFSSKVQQF